MAKRLKAGEWAARIKELRGATSQADFADHLHVTQSTVSSWERGDEKYEPSADLYFRLGILAAQRGSDPSWFWDQAETPVQALEAVIERRLKSRVFQPNPGDVIRVPLVSEPSLIAERFIAPSIESADRTVRLPAEFVLSVASTYCLEVRESGGSAFGSGDIVAIDSGITLMPQLWNQVVLVRFDANHPGRKEYWPAGLFMGVLRCVEYDRSQATWVAQLESLSDKFEVHPIWLNFWKPARSIGNLGDHDERKTLREEAKREAPVQLVKPMHGCTILGRMICWVSKASVAAERTRRSREQ